MNRINSFRQFWPHYLRQHRCPGCRALHYAGTVATVVTPIIAALTTPWLLLAVPLVGYGPAWFGHFVLEKNRPATFGHPLWALIADYCMFALWITGQLRTQLDAALAAETSGPAHPASDIRQAA